MILTVILAGVVLGILIASGAKWWIEKLAWDDRQGTFFEWSALVLVGSVMGTMVVTSGLRDIPAGSMVWDGGKFYAVVANKKQLTLWFWDYNIWTRNKNWQLVNFADPEKSSAAMHIQPITTNPKVRNLNYSVGVSVGNTPEDFIAWNRLKVNLQNWLEFQLYEFNEAHSRELAEFYNPASREHQLKFQSLLRAFLLPLIKDKGLYLTGSSFVL